MYKFLKYISLTLLFFSSNIKAQNLDSLKFALKNAKHDTTRCNILNLIIETESDDSIWPKYNEQLKTLAEKNLKNTNLNSTLYYAFSKHLAASLNNIGYSYSIQGYLPMAIESFSKSLKIQEKIDDKKEISVLLTNMGQAYLNLGNIPKALEYFDKSLKIQEKIKDKKGIANTLTRIGFIYFKQNDTFKALKYASKGLKIREAIGDNNGIAESLNFLGIAYQNQGNYSKALEYFSKSLKYREILGNKYGIAESLNNIGGIHKIQGNNPKALEYYINSLKIREKIGDRNGVSYALINIGVIYFKQNRLSESFNYANRSLLLSREIGFPENIKNAASILKDIYKKQNKFKEALEMYELEIVMRDSINNVETQKASIKQQTQYEYDKKKAIEDEKHEAELKVQDEKAQADKKRQNIIISSVSVVLILVVMFSLLLYNRFKTTQKQKQIIEVKEKETLQQKHIIEEKQKEILDSINYAKRIQYTLLAHEEFLKENLPEHFTYFNPKDIVSGDFYWATKHNNKFYFAVCDSTGHGVPGAFMSLLNIGFLTEAINEKGIEKPNEVFDYVRMKLTNTISKEGQKDGFDGILVCIDQNTKAITYASANNAPVLIKNNEFIELNADRMPVGIGERKENFTLHTLNVLKGDMLYLYTDGYADQFGGPKGKKFKYKQLNELLVSIHLKPLTEQHTELKVAFDNWKGDLEQVDDVCLIGIRI